VQSSPDLDIGRRTRAAGPFVEQGIEESNGGLSGARTSKTNQSIGNFSCWRKISISTYSYVSGHPRQGWDSSGLPLVHTCPYYVPSPFTRRMWARSTVTNTLREPMIVSIGWYGSAHVGKSHVDCHLRSDGSSCMFDRVC
jgi:hypothetical protein